MSTQHNSHAGHFSLVVPHITQKADVSSLSSDELLHIVFSRDSDTRRAYSFGALLQIHGFSSEVVLAAICLLLSPVPELRGTTLATIDAAIKSGIALPANKHIVLLVQVAKSEPSFLLTPWAIVLRHTLGDSTTVSDVVHILSTKCCANISEDEDRQVRRVLNDLYHRIVTGDKVVMPLF
jgi:hypothetical protein